VPPEAENQSRKSHGVAQHSLPEVRLLDYAGHRNEPLTAFGTLDRLKVDAANPAKGKG